MRRERLHETGILPVRSRCFSRGTDRNVGVTRHAGSVVRRTLVRRLGEVACRCLTGRGPFAQQPKLGAQAVDVVRLLEHHLVLFLDVAFQPGEPFFEPFNACVGHEEGAERRL